MTNSSHLIPQAFIDEVISRVDIVDVITESVTLRKTGSNWVANCPFHEEKTPSFTVSPVKQIYYCFGCQAGGSALSFLMRYQHAPFRQALEQLADRAGMELPTTKRIDPKQKKAQEGLHVLNAEVMEFYRVQFKKSVRAKSYLTSRGITDDVIEEYEIGYAPDDWNCLDRIFGHDEEKKQRMLILGLLHPRKSAEKGSSKTTNQCYNFFRDRIIFPIRNPRGQVVGFGGRTLGNKEPKYLNSSESPIFSKGAELYSLYQVARRPGKSSTLYLVEGYMDVVSLFQRGVDNAVAALGTTANERHLALMSRYAERVVVCFDGDRAGEKAARRILRDALPLACREKSISFKFLPEGEDPDSYVGHAGREAFLDGKNEQGLADYLLSCLCEGLSLENATDCAAYVDRALKRLEGLPRSALRTVIENEVMRNSRLSREQFDALKKKTPENTAVRARTMQQAPLGYSSRSRVAAQRSGTTRPNPLLTRVVHLLLHKPHLAAEETIQVQVARLGRDKYAFLEEMLAFIRVRGKTISSALIMEHWRDSAYAVRLSELAAKPPLLEDDIALHQELLAMLKKLEEGDRQKKRTELAKKVRDLKDLKDIVLKSSGLD